MNGYEQFLVVVLASFLAIFLLLGIVLLVLLIRVMRTVRRVSDRAEHLADKASAVGDVVQNAVGSMTLGRAVMTVADSVLKKRTAKSKRKD
ncbi:hypothetical protein CR970_02255 [Candidatus Saccharibacteria bacterium]|nr:MAG: hypothetical protein CR970_02255 [Candidatus Saccharibacteria bacterium]